MEKAVAVIDIGMTNKKVAIYDDYLKQVDVVYKTFEPKIIKNPITSQELKVHDLKEMETWFFEQIRLFSKKYPIKAISITTHGATFCCVDKDGITCAPCIFYTEDPGIDFQNEFYNLVGDKQTLQTETFTPAFDSMINPAKGIYYLKKYFSQDFAKTDSILFYPQYWGFLLTGVKGVEPTYAGCHTYLWNHEKQTWSTVTDKLGIKSLLPTNYKKTCSILGTLKSDIAKLLELPQSTVVTMGIHDSNASLLPYFAKENEDDFVLNSTGTWCVSMHPQSSFAFTKDDLGKIVFFNQSAFCTPIKTSIFLGGMEFDIWLKLYKKINNTTKFPESSEENVNELFKNKNTFLLPEIVHGSGQFTTSISGIMENEEFYSLEEIQKGIKIPYAIKDEKTFLAMLDVSLVIQTEVALKRAGLKEGTKVFTEGGFRKNKLYNALLSSVLKNNKTFRTSMEEATATGAAITAIIALTEKNISELESTINIEYLLDCPGSFIGYEEYKAKWIEIAQKNN